MQYVYIRLLAWLSLRELYGLTAGYWSSLPPDAPRDAPRSHVLISTLVIQLHYQWILYFVLPLNYTAL